MGWLLSTKQLKGREKKKTQVPKVLLSISLFSDNQSRHALLEELHTAVFLLA